jgi:hypothetical protein
VVAQLKIKLFDPRNKFRFFSLNLFIVCVIKIVLLIIADVKQITFILRALLVSQRA